MAILPAIRNLQDLGKGWVKQSCFWKYSRGVIFCWIQKEVTKYGNAAETTN